jgi:signal transduction histidine kinase
VSVSHAPVLSLHRIHLGFPDSQLEDAYLQHQHDENRLWVAGGIVLGILFLTGLSSLDYVYVKVGLERFQHIRFRVLIPTLIVGLIGYLIFKTPQACIRWIGSLAVVVALALAAMLVVGGDAGIDYVVAITCQSMLFVCFLVGLPFRWAAPITIFMAVVSMSAALTLTLTAGHLWFAIATLSIFSSLIIFVLFRSETDSRQNFGAGHLLQQEYAQRLSAERERNQWLAAFAGVLRHELKNAMIGISTSLELVGRTSLDREGTSYVDRATRSVQFMRRFLQHAADATSLEAALRQQESEALSLSDLVSARIGAFREEVPGMHLRLDIDPDILVFGDADSLVQMLDKLLNNAIEHGIPSETIEVSLKGQGKTVQLSVTDIGDPLPADYEKIFEPFLSQKERRGEDNLGLGLFVARVIVLHHKGLIRAEPLAGGSGARFIVELPRLTESLAPV